MSTTRNRHGSATVTLPSDTEILITRQFDAPAAIVFKAWTTPELVQRWWGFADDPWKVCEIDLRVGGAWRYVVTHTNDSGSFDVGFHGEFREIDAPHRLVSTEVYEGFPETDAEAINILTFAEVDGVTTLTCLVQHARKEHRDAHIESGMEGGMNVSMDRLEDLAGELSTAR